MHAIRSLFLGTAVLVLGCCVFAADAPEPKTLLTERGKLLFRDDLTQPLGKEWRAAKGKWEVVNGAIRGAEQKADMHGAVARHAMPFQNVIIQYDFKLEGARQTSLSINAAKGHLCRVVINPTTLSVRKDSLDKNVTDEAAVLDTRNTTVAPNVWHTLVIEIRGQEMLATLNGKETAFGSHPGLEKEKANFGFTVAGEAVSFRNLRVWEGLPNKDWVTTKTQLLQARASAGK